MTVLGYERIMQLLTGTDEYAFEQHMLVLVRSGLSPMRLRALRMLARDRRATASSLLKSLRENPSGGTYLALVAFLETLESEGILERDPVGRRTYWRFAQRHEDFRRYLEAIP